MSQISPPTRREVFVYLRQILQPVMAVEVVEETVLPNWARPSICTNLVRRFGTPLLLDAQQPITIGMLVDQVMAASRQ